jgi:SAM-dependent MidA family methyltransferase
MTFVPWEAAWQEALYGGNGFYRRGEGPASHFRTSVHASDLLATALLRLAEWTGLQRVVDVGSGRGELLQSLRRKASESGTVIELVGCDVVERPVALTADITWVRSPGGVQLPEALRPWLGDALVVAHEWLDDVPCPVVQRDASLTWRLVEVDPTSGRERLADPVDVAQLGWLDRWWTTEQAPSARDRAEVGLPRDRAWAQLVEAAARCRLLAVDYGHLSGARPPRGSLVGYRHGGACVAVPDGSCDVTAHVAVDAVAAAGRRAGAVSTSLTSQRQALRSLGVDGRLPEHALATRDPMGYLDAVSSASHAAELLDPAGLGGFTWLLQSTGPGR